MDVDTEGEMHTQQTEEYSGKRKGPHEENESDSVLDELIHNEEVMHAKLLKEYLTAQSSSVLDDDVEMSILKETYLTAKSELLNLQNASSDHHLDSIDDPCFLDNIKQELESVKSILMLQDIKKRNLIKENEKLVKMLKEENDFNNMMMSEHNKEAVPVHEASDTDRIQQTLHEKHRKLKLLQKDQMQHLMEFSGKYFSPPNRMNIREPHTADVHMPKLSLAAIIEKLIHQYRSESPWLKIDSSMWEEYTSLLFRLKIIERHPDDHLLVKLTDVD